jgi:hypothetical protein
MALNLLLSRVVLAAVVVVTSASEAVAQPFVGLASVFHNVVTGVGQTLSGYGKVDSINGVPIRESLCSNCELTYRFGNYVVSSISASEVKFTGGYMSLYLGKKKKQDELNPYASSSSAEDLAAATDGTLVLTLSGHAIDAAGNTLTATGVNIGGAVPMVLRQVWPMSISPGMPTATRQAPAGHGTHASPPTGYRHFSEEATQIFKLAGRPRVFYRRTPANVPQGKGPRACLALSTCGL